MAYFNYEMDRLTIPESKFGGHDGTLRCLCEMNSEGHILDQYTCAEFYTKKCHMKCDTCGIAAAIDKLVDYEETGLSPEEIKHYTGEGYKNYIEHIQQAQNEAFKHNINANAVLIGHFLRYGYLRSFPVNDIPMILGMQCIYTDELPDDVHFAVAELRNLPITQSEHIKALESENEELKAKLKQISALIENNDA